MKSYFFLFVLMLFQMNYGIPKKPLMTSNKFKGFQKTIGTGNKSKKLSWRELLGNKTRTFFINIGTIVKKIKEEASNNKHFAIAFFASYLLTSNSFGGKYWNEKIDAVKADIFTDNGLGAGNEQEDQLDDKITDEQEQEQKAQKQQFNNSIFLQQQQSNIVPQENNQNYNYPPVSEVNKASKKNGHFYDLSLPSIHTLYEEKSAEQIIVSFSFNISNGINSIQYQQLGLEEKDIADIYYEKNGSIKSVLRLLSFFEEKNYFRNNDTFAEFVKEYYNTFSDMNFSISCNQNDHNKMNDYFNHISRIVGLHFCHKIAQQRITVIPQGMATCYDEYLYHGITLVLAMITAVKYKESKIKNFIYSAGASIVFSTMASLITVAKIKRIANYYTAIKDSWLTASFKEFTNKYNSDDLKKISFTTTMILKNK